MQKIQEKIYAEILNYVIDGYATKKEGSLVLENNLTFPFTIKESLESISSEIINSIERNADEKVDLINLLNLIDENSNLYKFVRFNLSTKEQDIYQDLLTEDDGENASRLVELASEKANEEYVNLLDLVRLDIETLYNLV